MPWPIRQEHFFDRERLTDFTFDIFHDFQSCTYIKAYSYLSSNLVVTHHIDVEI